MVELPKTRSGAGRDGERRRAWGGRCLRRPIHRARSMQRGRAGQAGFTLLELLIVMVIIATLAAIAIPAYVRNVHSAREAALKEDLQVMRGAIDSYTVDKQKAPQTLQDLVTAGYLKAIPKDPMTGSSDTWQPAESDVLATVDQTDSGGIDDVHSGSQLTGTDGTAYNTW